VRLEVLLKYVLGCRFLATPGVSVDTKREHEVEVGNVDSDFKTLFKASDALSSFQYDSIPFLRPHLPPLGFPRPRCSCAVTPRQTLSSVMLYCRLS